MLKIVVAVYVAVVAVETALLFSEYLLNLILQSMFILSEYILNLMGKLTLQDHKM